RLLNNADPGITYPDVTVANINAFGQTTVTWTITTPAAVGWIPMQVIADYTGVITEINEPNHQAIRPFINGDFALSGDIQVIASASPATLCPEYGRWTSICGTAYYRNTAVQLQDSSVAGATVTITLPQTGQTFTGLTNSAGHFCISLQA